MGTVFELQIVTLCKDKPSDQIILKAQAILDKMEREMSLYQPTSDISQLNKEGKVKIPSPEFKNVVEMSIVHGNKTQGAFDISVWPVLLKIQNSFKINRQPPTEDDLKNLKPLVDYKQIEVSEDQIKFKNSNMMITLDGVAKGYAVDLLFDFFKSQGYQNILLNFSGNMRWSGHRQDGKKWKVQRWNPFSQKVEKIPSLKSGAIASSGIDINNYSEDKKWHHIINPQTLHPANEWISTTVVGPNAAVCDILSTAIFTLSKDQLQKMIPQEYSDYKVWAVNSKGKVFKF